MNGNMKKRISISVFLIGLCILIGIGLLVFGVNKKIAYNNKIKGYESVDGYFVDTEVYSKSTRHGRHRTNTTYYLIYAYNVDGVEYTARTDYGSGAIPQKGSVKEILYNPENPSEAVVTGTNAAVFVIFMGIFFVLIPLVMIFGILDLGGIFEKLRFHFMDVIIGLVLLVVGLGVSYIIVGGFSLGKLFMLAGPFAVIPILFVFVGASVIGKGIGIKLKKWMVCLFAGAFLLTIIVGFKLAADGREQIAGRFENTRPIMVDFSDVHTVLSDRGFETANVPTTYWFYDEDKLTNVVSGIKEGTAFEFYEYTDGETTDGVFNSISYDISQKMEQSERDEKITELPGGGKMFHMTENGIFSLVLYKHNTVIYAHSNEKSTDILDILSELGCEAAIK